MSVFNDHSAFDPMRDSKVPVKRGAVWLAVRAIHVLAKLGFSRHPSDAWVWARSMVARRRPLSMAIPWLTFDAIREINALLPQRPEIFEFGSGHSTLYWANLAQSDLVWSAPGLGCSKAGLVKGAERRSEPLTNRGRVD